MKRRPSSPAPFPLSLSLSLLLSLSLSLSVSGELGPPSARSLSGYSKLSKEAVIRSFLEKLEAKYARRRAPTSAAFSVADDAEARPLSGTRR